MSDVTVKDHLPEFANKALAAFDRALNNAGIEILRTSKMQQAPHLHGQLWSSGKIVRNGLCDFEVSYNTPYAAYQEYGSYSDGSHVIRQHTEPGTKTHYLQDPGDLVSKNFATQLKSTGEGVR